MSRTRNPESFAENQRRYKRRLAYASGDWTIKGLPRGGIIPARSARTAYAKGETEAHSKAIKMLSDQKHRGKVVYYRTDAPGTKRWVGDTKKNPKQEGVEYTIKPLHIDLVRAGDTILHDGRLKTVNKSNIKRGATGKTLFGDSYRLGQRLVPVAVITHAKPTKKNPARKCTICGKPVVLSPSAQDRAKKFGGAAEDYYALFPNHAECVIAKRSAESRALMKTKKNPARTDWLGRPLLGARQLTPRQQYKRCLSKCVDTCKRTTPVKKNPKQGGIEYTIEPLHIDMVRAGDTILRDGILTTVNKSNIKRGGMGKTLFGDSYRLGQRLVPVAVIKHAKPVKKNPRRTPVSKKCSIPKGKRHGDTFTRSGQRFQVISYSRDGKRIRYARKAQ